MAVLDELVFHDDDARPGWRIAVAADPRAQVSVIVEECAPGDGIVPHVHAIDEVVFVEVGVAQLTLGTDTRAASAGAIVFVPAGVPHGMWNSDRSTIRTSGVFPSTLVEVWPVERAGAPRKIVNEMRVLHGGDIAAGSWVEEAEAVPIANATRAATVVDDPGRLLEIVADLGDPDDWRLASRMAVLAAAAVDMAVIVEEIASGESIPLHTHLIDEVILFDGGSAEVRLGSEQHEVGQGAVVFVPAGMPHGTRNTGREPVRLRAVFPSHLLSIHYVERNPAPGTEDADPQPPSSIDARLGWSVAS